MTPLAVLLSGVTLMTHAAAEDPAAADLTVFADRDLGAIDPRVYGHFFEHIYRSANGGLWGEALWNLSFALFGGEAGIWSSEDGWVRQHTTARNPRLFFCDPAWTDYTYSLTARKDSGFEGFLIPVRVNGAERFYWLNLGGWGNNYTALEKSTPEGRAVIEETRRPMKMIENRDYAIRIQAEGSRIRAWLDGDSVLDWIDPDAPHLSGRVGLPPGSPGRRSAMTTARVPGTPRRPIAGACPAVWLGARQASALLPDSWGKKMLAMQR